MALSDAEYRFMCDLMDGDDGTSNLERIGRLNNLMTRGLIVLGFKPSLDGQEQVTWYEARANFSTDRTVIKEDPEKLAKLIAARVKGFGLLSARKLVSGLGTLDNIINAEPADLDAIFGKGSIKSIHLHKYLSDPANVDHLRPKAQSKTKTHKGEDNGIEN